MSHAHAVPDGHPDDHSDADDNAHAHNHPDPHGHTYADGHHTRRPPYADTDPDRLPLRPRRYRTPSGTPWCASTTPQEVRAGRTRRTG